MISAKLAAARSAGSFRTGAVSTNVIVWPAGVRTGILVNESGGKKNGVTMGGVNGGNASGGIKRGGWMPFAVPPIAEPCRGWRTSVIGNLSSSKSLAIVFGPTMPSGLNWFDF